MRHQWQSINNQTSIMVCSVLQIYAWGSNRHALSGGRDGDAPSRVPIRVKKCSKLHAVSVHSSSGAITNGAIDKDGRIWMWGANDVRFTS